MNVDTIIRRFADFLNVSWDIVIPALTNRSYASGGNATYDWLQANWEIFVEMEVLGPMQYLEIYSEGADLNTTGRVTFVEAIPTHVIKVSGKENLVLDVLNNEMVNIEKVVFEELVSFKDGYYCIAPPFNHVLLEDTNIAHSKRVVHINDVLFQLTHL